MDKHSFLYIFRLTVLSEIQALVGPEFESLIKLSYSVFSDSTDIGSLWISSLLDYSPVLQEHIDRKCPVKDKIKAFFFFTSAASHASKINLRCHNFKKSFLIALYTNFCLHRRKLRERVNAVNASLSTPMTAIYMKTCRGRQMTHRGRPDRALSHFTSRNREYT